MNKKNVLINASAAKCGGALTILNLFCRSKSSDEFNFYFIISPVKPSFLPKHSKWIKLSTSGVYTTIFSLLVVNFYYFIYKCDKVISFSNLNSVLPLKERVTYFHNILICDSPAIKYKLIRFVHKYLNQKTCMYIFQTDFVYQRFLAVFFKVDFFKIAWPGLELDLSGVSKISDDGAQVKEHMNKYYVVPIVNLDNLHKNFKMIVNIASQLVESKHIEFRVTAKSIVFPGLPHNIKFIGPLTREDFLNEVANSSGVLNVSTNETLCLPIFESICLNKPAFVLNADFLSGLYSHFSEINGLYVFNDVTSACCLLESFNMDSNIYSKQIYIDGYWDI